MNRDERRGQTDSQVWRRGRLLLTEWTAEGLPEAEARELRWLIQTHLRRIMSKYATPAETQGMDALMQRFEDATKPGT